MTRDELIDRLSVELEPVELAKAICHDAFDYFADALTPPETPSIADAADLVAAWTFYRCGWDARARAADS